MNYTVYMYEECTGGFSYVYTLVHNLVTPPPPPPPHVSQAPPPRMYKTRQ